ncbi:MAG: secretin and TonB N-terminal domain-containing protein [Candidatus Omnitrophota bacterium]
MRYSLTSMATSILFLCNSIFAYAQEPKMPPPPEVVSKVQNIPQPIAEKAGAEKKTSSPATTVLRVNKVGGGLFSMELRDVEIGDLLRVLAHDYNLNIIMDRRIKGRITASFSNITLDEALARIVENNNLTYKKMGNVIKVTPCLISKTFVLRYLQAKDIIQPAGSSEASTSTSSTGTSMSTGGSSSSGQYGENSSAPTAGAGGPAQTPTQNTPAGAPPPQAGATGTSEQPKNNTIYDLLSPEGKIFFDNEANSIMVIDYPSNLKMIGKYLSKVDLLPRQVLIEAKIVEVQLQKEHSLGVNWKAFMEKGSLPIGPVRIGSLSTLGNTPSPLEQSIPYKSTVYPPTQATGTVESPFTISIFNENINVVIKTLAAVLNTDILSAPRVTTVNNHEAKIEMIQRYPWAEPQTDIAGQSGSVTTSWKVNYEDLGITLLTTPTINSDGTITLVLNPEVTERTGDITLKLTQGTTSIDYAVPIINKRAAATKVVVGNGQTLILGGLIKDKITKGESKVPLIGDIPYFGYFFKTKKETRDKTELLIFVSPTIITRQKAMASEELPAVNWSPTNELGLQKNSQSNIVPAKRVTALKPAPLQRQTKKQESKPASLMTEAKPEDLTPALDTANKEKEIQKMLTLLDKEAAKQSKTNPAATNAAVSGGKVK